MRTALVLTLAALVLSGCGSTDDSSDPDTQAAGSCSYPAFDDAAKSVKAPPADPPSPAPTTITITTNSGVIPLTLEPDLAPCTVNSFVSLAQQGFYDNTSCHRMLTVGDYILQCGDPNGDGRGGPGYTIPDELVANDPRLQPCDAGGTCTYPGGTIAMANRSQPDTGGSQFFLMYEDSPFPPNYTVFGRTNASGLKVLKAIGAKGTAGGAPDGAPIEPVTITSVK
ncbi:peptidylprolyl isomerase [Nocardioides marmoriginsengisoli]|uniref:Peptidylprolyl isomerase n=1 Tax=Nocardioides marmoriginsengisoli TaxID=661483 RepID=A0A3N0CQI1_9ACTN|nr:peptidylprolyl isomerase [Nocardioides marmoriginsengisoli]RNL65718.1 peptidylprolyl isomerase [Nocardioides marmoriginsengisoli]